MPANLINKGNIKEPRCEAAGLDNDQGDPRLKEVLSVVFMTPGRH